MTFRMRFQPYTDEEEYNHKPIPIALRDPEKKSSAAQTRTAGINRDIKLLKEERKSGEKGERGEKGEIGEKGEKGERGERGEKGERSGVNNYPVSIVVETDTCVTGLYENMKRIKCINVIGKGVGLLKIQSPASDNTLFDTSISCDDFALFRFDFTNAVQEEDRMELLKLTASPESEESIHIILVQVEYKN